MTDLRYPVMTSSSVLRPWDPGFDDACCGYNLSVRHHPAVVVLAATAGDVLGAVGLAVARGRPVAVQATGHGPSVPADGAVLVNTSRMDAVTVDPVARTARIEAGVRSGALVAAAAEHGLAPLNGSAPDVGAVSYHLGGGVGIMGRSLGWAVDHVRALEVVTADGVLRRVDATHEPELFWGLRGGGRGTLGIVVALEIDLHPVTRLYGGGLWFTGPDVPAMLHAYAAWTPTVPEQMGSSVLVIRMPDLPGVPEPLRGRHVGHVRIAYTGPAAEGARLVRPLRALGPVQDTVREMPYAEVGTIHAEPTAPVAFHARNQMLGELDPGGVDELLRHVGPDASAPYLVELRHMGGALGRPPVVPNALGRRDGEFVLYTGAAAGPDEAADVQAAMDRLHEDMRPWGTGGVCLNFLSGPRVREADVRSGRLAAETARLDALTRAVDPADVFRVHHGRTPRGRVAVDRLERC